MPEDRELIEKVLKGDRHAFGLIYDIYAAHLYRYVSFRVSQTQDVEDILSNVFLRSFEALVEGKKVTHLRAFLYQTARNAIVDYFRQRARTQEHEADISEEEVTVETGSVAVDTQVDLVQVQQGMKSLKPEYQEIIQLRYVEELDIEEIALALDKSRVAIRVSLHRALRALKKQLGVTP